MHKDLTPETPETSFSQHEGRSVPIVKATLWLTKDLQALFNSFYRKEIPLDTLIFFMILLSTFAVISVYGLLQTPAKGTTPYLTVSFISGLLVVVGGWIFVYFKYCAKYFYEKCKTPWDAYGRSLQNICVILMACFFGLRLYARMDYGSCESNRLGEYLFCNPNAHSSGFPEDSCLGATIFLLTYTTILRDTDVRAVAVSYSILSTSFFASAIRNNSQKSVFISIFYYMIIVAITLYSNQKQNIRSFIIQQQLSAVIKQNEVMAEELRANELRHMIGNVAHDLKTPLASFVSGLDMIAEIAKDELQKLSEGESNAVTSNSSIKTVTNSSVDVKQMKESLDCILSTVQNNRNVNNFMMMTINRCIDYTKASRGLKLVPKYETIDLVETLYLPFRCMRDVSQKVRINLEPISMTICSHIITDKQWLQENVLCLLSNAVKYSAGGLVNGRMILTTAEAIGGPQQSAPVNSTRADASSCRVSPIVSQSPSPDNSQQHRSNKQVLLVEIEDTGIGMTEEAMLSLFDAFKRAQKFAGGTGLGLFSLAKRIEALGGVYGVRKRDDGIQGSLFWFTIPYRPDHTFADPSQEDRNLALIEFDSDNRKEEIETKSREKVETLPYLPNGKGLRILIVDDSASIQKMMSMMLRRHGHMVDQAENGAQAVTMLRTAYEEAQRRIVQQLEGQENRSEEGDSKTFKWEELISMAYDVVLMDLQMPVMDGLEATKRVRSVEAEQMKQLLMIHNKYKDKILCGEGQDSADTVEIFDRHAGETPHSRGRNRRFQEERSLHLDFNNNIYKNDTKRIENIQSILSKSCHQLILGVSANSDTDTMKEALNAGADAFMSKPFSVDSFYTTYNKCFHITNKLYKPQ